GIGKGQGALTHAHADADGISSLESDHGNAAHAAGVGQVAQCGKLYGLRVGHGDASFNVGVFEL
ncbi:hypothetical protein, partial [Xanthomonas euvesicatoria]|uniref:hypothetical protein n=1 Tax=Xanthomonas euvesicatoria TaxID=456327 RepID=UPI0019D3C231